jgi:hypothetical protein
MGAASLSAQHPAPRRILPETKPHPTQDASACCARRDTLSLERTGRACPAEPRPPGVSGVEAPRARSVSRGRRAPGPTPGGYGHPDLGARPPLPHSPDRIPSTNGWGLAGRGTGARLPGRPGLQGRGSRRPWVEVHSNRAGRGSRKPLVQVAAQPSPLTAQSTESTLAATRATAVGCGPYDLSLLQPSPQRSDSTGKLWGRLRAGVGVPGGGPPGWPSEGDLRSNAPSGNGGGVAGSGRVRHAPGRLAASVMSDRAQRVPVQPPPVDVAKSLLRLGSTRARRPAD